MSINAAKKYVDRVIKNFKYSLFGQISSTLSQDNTVFIRFGDEEELRDVKILAPYGFNSLPVPGSFGQALFNNSNKSAVLVGVEDSKGSPVVLNIGESIIYNNTAGTYMHFKNDGKIYIKGQMINV